MEDFADGDRYDPARITAKELVVSVYANQGDMLEGSDLGKHRMYTFLNNK